LPSANAKYRSDQASMPTSIMTLMPNLRRTKGSSSMNATSDICPNVWMKAASGTLISFKNGLAKL
jgi:hypothetical protein